VADSVIWIRGKFVELVIMKAYLGEAEGTDALSCRLIKLGLISRILAGMSNVAQYFVEFDDEELCLHLVFENGEKTNFSTAGLEGLDPFMKKDELKDIMNWVFSKSDSVVVPVLRKTANQSENEGTSQEHRFYTSLAVFVAGRVPSLLMIMGEAAPFSDVTYVFNLNGKATPRVVQFPKPPAEKEHLTPCFQFLQQAVIKKSIALVGGHN
jgi:hypothetical protein